MNVWQSQWTAAGGLQAERGGVEASAQLAFLFGSRAALQNGASIAAIRGRFPAARFLGCSTAGEILDTVIYDDTVSVTAVQFDATRVVAASVAIASAAESYAAGATLARSFPPDGLVHLFVLSDGLNLNGSELVKGVRENLPAGTQLSGGLSGDGEAFGETMIVFDDAVLGKTVAAAGFSGGRPARCRRSR